MVRIAPVLLAVGLLGGCVYVPATHTSYDEKCRTYARHMTLERHQIGTLMGCANESCVAALVVFGAVSAASAVVSGSVVVVGNVAYWLEKQGQCLANEGTHE